MNGTDSNTSMKRIQKAATSVNPTITDVISSGITQPKGIVVYP